MYREGVPVMGETEKNEPGNTGVAGGTKGASPVPQPEPPNDEQNKDYPNGDDHTPVDHDEPVG